MCSLTKPFLSIEKESNQMVAKEIETDNEDDDSEDYEVYSEMD